MDMDIGLTRATARGVIPQRHDWPPARKAASQHHHPSRSHNAQHAVMSNAYWPLQGMALLPSRLCTNQSSFHSSGPPALPTLLQYDCTAIGQYTTPPPTPLLYAIHHTTLVIPISCKGQNAYKQPAHWMVPSGRNVALTVFPSKSRPLSASKARIADAICS